MPATVINGGEAGAAHRQRAAVAGDAQVNRDRSSPPLVTRSSNGTAVALDDIARRAGTGIATLYRRFPDREALMRAVVLDALERTADEARQAIEKGIRSVRRARAIHARGAGHPYRRGDPALLDEISIVDEEMTKARDGR